MPQSTAPPPSPESLTASQFARRERIVRVALKLLVHGDYEKIQMKDVAEGSDVALGTVYRYFTSKEHLFAAVQLEWVKSLHRQILKRPPAGDSNLERLSQVLHQSVRAFQTQPQFYRVLLVLEVTKDPFAKELYEVMARETEATYLESVFGLDPTMASSLLGVVQAVLGAQLRSWVLGRQSIAEVKRNLDAALCLLFTYRDEASLAVAPAGGSDHS